MTKCGVNGGGQQEGSGADGGEGSGGDEPNSTSFEVTNGGGHHHHQHYQPHHLSNGFTNFAYDDVPLSDDVGKIVVGGDDFIKGQLGEEFDVSTIHNAVPESSKTNYIQTLMHLLNGFIGSGILSMPMAFRDGGIILATILNPIIGVMSCYCIHMLLTINRWAMKATNRKMPYEYHELALYAFSFGPKPLRPWARTASLVVLSTVIATQIGGCCVYFTFIATNLEKFLINRMGKENAPKKEICLLLVLPLALAINCIRNIRHLTFFSTVSNFFQVAGLGIIFYHLFDQPLKDPFRLPAVGDLEKIPKFFVSTLFIFEGISVSMSLYKAIRDPRQFHRPLGVLNVGLAIIIAFYFSIGFFGYVQFGAAIAGTITVNLPAEPMYDAVQLLYAFAVLLTYPIILYVPIQVLWPIIRRKVARRLKVADSQKKADNSFSARAKLMTVEFAFRAALVLSTYILAAVIPKLELIISLVGSVTSSTVTITIPAILYTVAFWNQEGPLGKFFLVLVNGTLLIIGLGGLGFGFYYSLLDIIDSYKTGTPDDDVEKVARLVQSGLMQGILGLNMTTQASSSSSSFPTHFP